MWLTLGACGPGARGFCSAFVDPVRSGLQCQGQRLLHAVTRFHAAKPRLRTPSPGGVDGCQWAPLAQQRVTENADRVALVGDLLAALRRLRLLVVAGHVKQLA